MPYTVRWYTLHQVIEVQLKGVFSLHEAEELVAHFVEMLTEAKTHAPNNRVYLFYDTLEAESMPPIYTMLKRGLPVLRLKNRGPVFAVTSNKTIRNILELTGYVSRFQVFSFLSRADALQALHAALARDELQGPA